MSDYQLTCASELLADFVSPFTATAVRNLLMAGARPVGKTNMDEFAMGSDTTNSIYGRSCNPWDITRSPGGSSGGSAAAVAGGMVPFALGSDTGGSVRQPASLCGIWGLKPTYGAVSRYGLVAFASSLDVIGIFAEESHLLKRVFDVIRVRGSDEMDNSSYYPLSEQELPSNNVKKIGMFIPEKEITDSVKKAMELAQTRYAEKGYEVVPISLPFMEYAGAVYSIISSAEASANLARFDGVRYGKRASMAENHLELIKDAREQGFGREVKLRLLIGAYVLRSGFQDQYYLKAQKLRSRISQQLRHLFSEVDLLALPVFPVPAFKPNDKDMDEFRQKTGDTYSAVANLSGMPAVSLPVLWDNDLPIGLQVMAPHYAEQRLFSFLDSTRNLFEHRHSPYAETIARQLKTAIPSAEEKDDA